MSRCTDRVGIGIKRSRVVARLGAARHMPLDGAYDEAKAGSSAEFHRRQAVHNGFATVDGPALAARWLLPWRLLHHSWADSTRCIHHS